MIASTSRARSTRVAVLYAAAAATLSFVQPQAGFGATPTYQMSASTATFRHKAGPSNIADHVLTFKPGSSSSMTLWSDPLPTVGGPPNSLATAGLGSVTNPTTTTFALKGGTGITQLDPGAAWPASTLTMTFTGQWQVPSTAAFGPTTTAYFSMAYGGAGGGTKTARVMIDYYLGASKLKFFDSGILSATTAVKTYTNSQLFNGGTVPANSIIKAVGTIVFSANNGPGATEFRPFSMDCGNAPPTATWQSDVGGNWTTGDWSATDSAGDALVETAPNTAGYRARFANLALNPTGAVHSINVNTPITIGTLDIDDDDAFAFSGSTLTFDVQQGDAVIRTGNTAGAGGTDTMTTTVLLSDSVVVQTEGEAVGDGRGLTAAKNLVINGQILDATNTQSLTKIGESSLSLGGDNSYGGGTSARGGYLDANVTSSLGTGTVLADDGQLNYNAAHASAPAVISNAQNSGQVNLGIVPTTEKFAVHDLGAISGSFSELIALSLLAGGNFTLDTGGMVAHESFDFGKAGNPAGLFNSPTAAYIFGIAADFTAPGTESVTVGSASGTVWKGFGGDRGNRIYGGDPNSGSVTLTASGTTELVSLHNSLTINARLQNSGASSIIKRGGGTVIINNVNNPYAGPITIQGGTLAVNGGLNNITSLNVTAGGTLATRAAGVLTASTITLTGGQAQFNGGNIHVNTLIPFSGELHQTGGSLTIATQYTANPGFLSQFSGGSCLINSNFSNNGTLVVDGGNLAINLVLGGPSTSGVIVTDGTLTANAASGLNGQTVIDGGRVAFNNALSMASLSALKYNGGTFTVANTLTVNGGSFLIGAGADRLLKVGNAATPAGGKIDLNDSDMMVTAGTYAGISALVASGRADGAWTGSGITSTAARTALPANTTLGVLTGAEYLTTGNTTFDGQPVVPSSVLVKYTYYGDTDFNGQIDFDDYSHTDQGFNSNFSGWFNGDFDYNGIVDFDDYSLIDMAFNTQAGSLRPAMQLLRGERVVMDGSNDTPALRMVRDHFAQFGQPYANAFLAAVPEPGAAGLALVMIGATFRRSRRIN
ncbi:MAG: autotransporter-associated beta strand repeat-containing protein [Anaerolineae bacterium]|nr:autotransporter-associated beta strand repeat-containing protein [Phycisphaerae bacterium]